MTHVPEAMTARECLNLAAYFDRIIESVKHHPNHHEVEEQIYEFISIAAALKYAANQKEGKGGTTK